MDVKGAIQRVGAVASVALALGVVATGVSVAMHATHLVSPDWLPYRLAGGGFEKDIVQRIEAAEGLYKNNALPDERPLCALIGLSGLREAGDLKQLARLSDNRCRFIGLSGAGGAIDTLGEQSRRLLDGTLRPDVAVVGIAEFLLVKPAPPRPAAPGGGDTTPAWVDALRRGDVRLVAKTFKDGLWFIERRRDVNGTAEAAMVGVKQTLLRVMGATGSATNNPLQDPWREMIRMEVPEHMSATALRVGIDSYRSKGAFDPKSYDAAQVAEQTKALTDIVRRLKERGSVVLVAIMPEHSAMRANIPPEAVQAVEQSLKNAFGDQAPAIVNLRDAVPDTGFTDVTHVNNEGRRAVSERLAPRIVEALPKGQRPLMLQGSPQQK
jgi:hypothetical protein